MWSILPRIKVPKVTTQSTIALKYQLVGTILFTQVLEKQLAALSKIEQCQKSFHPYLYLFQYLVQ